MDLKTYLITTRAGIVQSIDEVDSATAQNKINQNDGEDPVYIAVHAPDKASIGVSVGDNVNDSDEMDFKGFDD